MRAGARVAARKQARETDAATAWTPRTIRVPRGEITEFARRYVPMGTEWHLFGRDPESGHDLVDEGCSGQWDGRVAFEHALRHGAMVLGITEFKCYRNFERETYDLLVVGSR